MSERPELGRIGVWTGGPASPELARGLEELGYGAIWIGGSPGGDLEGVERTLAATSRLTVATGIVKIWNDEPARIAASYHRLADSYGSGSCWASVPDIRRRRADTPNPMRRWCATWTNSMPAAYRGAGERSPRSARRCCAWRLSGPQALTPIW